MPAARSSPSKNKGKAKELILPSPPASSPPPPAPAPKEDALNVVAPVADEPEPEEPEETAAEEEERHRIWDLFAEEYHDIVAELPLEYQRSFLLLTELEDAQQSSTNLLKTSLLSYIATLSNPPAPSISGTTDDEDGPASLSTSAREQLLAIAKAARGAVRAGEEKVGIALALYESVDRHIRHLDSSLLRSEDSLLIGLRAGTLPSHDAPSKAPKSPPGRTTGWGARAVAIGEEEDDRGRGRGRGRKGKKKKVEAEEEEEAVGMPVDPNEPTYCFCNRVSFGEMIACENDDCAREWFHFTCVGLEVAPERQWYCPDCAELNKTKKGGSGGATGKKKRKR